jgi:membrane-associated phospholipid phosphatase
MGMKIHAAPSVATIAFARAAVVCCASAVAPAAYADGHQHAGDVLRFALPAGVVAIEAWNGDKEGLWQFGTSYVLTVGATEVLKRTVRSERPDHSNNHSFPSGHASSAFAAATYMHRRHGFEAAWPWYVGATYVGWTRVHAHRHRWADVAGGAGLAAASSWWLVEPKEDAKVVVIPSIGRGRIAIEVHARW